MSKVWEDWWTPKRVYKEAGLEDPDVFANNMVLVNQGLPTARPASEWQRRTGRSTMAAAVAG